MANDKHLAILKKGVAAWNKWREDNPGISPDLSYADLRATNLALVNFAEANLSHADLIESDLAQAIFLRSDLTAAILHHANLFKSTFYGAYLPRANLSWADLSYANFCNANMSETILFGVGFSQTRLDQANIVSAKLAYTIFSNLDLSMTRGLDKLDHQGPSTIGIDTIYRSKGRIPDEFLRGAGVPDDMIGYIHSIAGAIQFYSCFISYSSKDQEFAERLYADLQAKGVRCWFAPHDVQGGQKLHEQIDQAIRVYDKLLLILSESSMNSEWVKTEIANARQRETREKKQMLFPVALVPYERIREWKAFDADTGKDSAREIREYYIPDFSHWKDIDSYQKAFDRLLRDLKAEAKHNN
ncbi:MAG: toll/interleukin-1 receptor domain-containing protein [Acidobacteria bacterium]|nr:toll/interleukin-1 receptor domain-containing protein [Acidobacteriota bacterium]